MLNKILLSSSLVALFAGCGGMQPDTVWEVSRLDSPTPATCYTDGKIPTDGTVTMGVQTNVGPWEIYAGPSDKYYLQLADKKTMIEGSKGDSFTFAYSTVTTRTNPFPMQSLTDTEVVNISFKLESDTLSGTYESKVTHACSGAMCNNLSPNCTTTGTLKGRKLDVSRYRIY